MGCSSEGKGGALSLQYNGGATLRDVRFTSNHAREGAAIQKTGNGELNVMQATFENNTSTLGGAVVLDIDADAHTTFSNCSLVRNAVTRNGGAFHVLGHGRAVFDNVTLASNAAFSNGGGLLIQGDAIASFRGSVLVGNTARRGGLASLSGNAQLVLSDSLVAENEATVSGGVLHMYDSSGLLATSCQITRNRASEGGGVLSVASDHESVSVALTQCAVRNNSAGALGGVAVFEQRASADFVVSGGMVTGNVAPKGGAFVSGNAFAVPLITDGATVEGNVATQQPEGGDFLSPPKAMAMEYLDAQAATALAGALARIDGGEQELMDVLLTTHTVGGMAAATALVRDVLGSASESDVPDAALVHRVVSDIAIAQTRDDLATKYPGTSVDGNVLLGFADAPGAIPVAGSSGSSGNGFILTMYPGDELPSFRVLLYDAHGAFHPSTLEARFFVIASLIRTADASSLAPVDDDVDVSDGGDGAEVRGAKRQSFEHGVALFDDAVTVHARVPGRYVLRLLSDVPDVYPSDSFQIDLPLDVLACPADRPLGADMACLPPPAADDNNDLLVKLLVPLLVVVVMGGLVCYVAWRAVKNRRALEAQVADAKDWLISLDDLRLTHFLGQGAFGAVYAGQYKGAQVAVKLLLDAGRRPKGLVIPPSEKAPDSFSTRPFAGSRDDYSSTALLNDGDSGSVKQRMARNFLTTQSAYITADGHSSALNPLQPQIVQQKDSKAVRDARFQSFLAEVDVAHRYVLWGGVGWGGVGRGGKKGFHRVEQHAGSLARPMR